LIQSAGNIISAEGRQLRIRGLTAPRRDIMTEQADLYSMTASTQQDPASKIFGAI
jgi:hypothetical protein